MVNRSMKPEVQTAKAEYGRSKTSEGSKQPADSHLSLSSELEWRSKALSNNLVAKNVRLVATMRLVFRF